MTTELDTVAEELYRLEPAQFIATRDLRAAQARQSGSRKLAAAIKALRRPTTSAWLANLLARERGAEIGRLLDLAAAMRRAQRNLVGEDLRQLSRQRRQLIAALSAEARELAAQTGAPVGDQAVRQLEGTLEAALADEEVGEALRAGRLSTALSPMGFPPESTGAAVSGSVRDRAPGEQDAPPHHGGPARGIDQLDAARRKRHEAEAAEERRAAQAEEWRRAVEAAEQTSVAAQAVAAQKRREADDRGRLHHDAVARGENLRGRLRDLEERLEALRHEEAQASEDVAAAGVAAEQADTAARAAEEAAAREALHLEQLRREAPEPDR